MEIKDYIRQEIITAIGKLGAQLDDDKPIILEQPKQEIFGDISTPIALNLAKQLKKPPGSVAQDLLTNLVTNSDYIEKVDIAGPGFINFTLTRACLCQELKRILQEGDNFGKSNVGKGKRYQFEFVSANPTGPLNIVSARAAAVGDVLANLYQTIGYDVKREYLVNDAGRQVRLLGASLSARYMELTGKDEAFPEDGYHGDYIRDLARSIFDREGDKYAVMPGQERHAVFSELAVNLMLANHQEMMQQYRVHFDVWFRESELRKSQEEQNVLQDFAEKSYTYEKDGATWFRSTDFGDEKDRVLVTSEGESTYFLVDIAYHRNKFVRGFQILHDLWGPDHHGYIKRMTAAIQALGYPPESFKVNIIQQVNLLRAGQTVKMSKRAGEIVEMAELLDEVGIDAPRFFFVDRRISTHLDFDIELAKKQTEENPVYYLQYAHARVVNILGFARENGLVLSPDTDLSVLAEPGEMTLVKKLLEFPEIIEKAAEAYEPQRLTNYLRDVATVFHKFYHDHRVVSNDRTLTNARLLLTEATRIVLKNGFRILGINAPERM